MAICSTQRSAPRPATTQRQRGQRAARAVRCQRRRPRARARGESTLDLADAAGEQPSSDEPVEAASVTPALSLPAPSSVASSPARRSQPQRPSTTLASSPKRAQRAAIASRTLSERRASQHAPQRRSSWRTTCYHRAVDTAATGRRDVPRRATRARAQRRRREQDPPSNDTSTATRSAVRQRTQTVTRFNAAARSPAAASAPDRPSAAAREREQRTLINQLQSSTISTPAARARTGACRVRRRAPAHARVGGGVAVCVAAQPRELGGTAAREVVDDCGAEVGVAARQHLGEGPVRGPPLLAALPSSTVAPAIRVGGEAQGQARLADAASPESSASRRLPRLPTVPAGPRATRAHAPRPTNGVSPARVTLGRVGNGHAAGGRRRSPAGGHQSSRRRRWRDPRSCAGAPRTARRRSARRRVRRPPPGAP